MAYNLSMALVRSPISSAERAWQHKTSELEAGRLNFLPAIADCLGKPKNRETSQAQTLTISSPGTQAGCRGTGAAQATLLLKRRDRLRLAAGLRGEGGTDWSPRTSQRRRAPS